MLVLAFSNSHVFLLIQLFLFCFSGTPEPPILQASSSSPTSVLVSWSMLTSVTYQLRYRMQGLMTVWITVDNDIPSTETSRRVNDLMPNTVYEFEIRATATDNDLQSPANITSAITSE